MERNRCSTETYSSPMALASSSAFTSTLLASWLKYTCPPDTFGSFSMASCTSFKNWFSWIPILVISFKIRLSSMVSRL